MYFWGLKNCFKIKKEGCGWNNWIYQERGRFNKKTFKELSNSSENIATNILADRLKGLEEKGILTRNDVKDNKKTKHYKLTKKGLGLKPMLQELGKWSTTHLKNQHPKMLSKEIFLEISHSK